MKGTNGLETHVDSQECCEPLHDEGSLDGTIKTSLGVCKLKATYASELDASGTDVCSQDFWKNWTLNIDGILLCPCIPCPDFIGCWDMKANLKVCVSGVGCQSSSGNACIQASADGSFDWWEEGDILFSGTWSEPTKCKKVRADFDKDEVAEFMESLCLELGDVFCDATVSTAEALVTLVDNARVSGTLKFTGTLSAEGRTANWSITGGFTGVRTANCASISALRDTSNPMLTVLARQIFSMIK